MNRSRKGEAKMRKTRRNISPGGPAYDRKTIARLFSYMKAYRGRLLLVVVCILISAVAGAAGSLLLQVLIDDHIAALLVSPDPVFTGCCGRLRAWRSYIWPA